MMKKLRLRMIMLSTCLIAATGCADDVEPPALPEVPDRADPAEIPAEPVGENGSKPEAVGTEPRKPLDLTAPDMSKEHSTEDADAPPSRAGNYDAATLFNGDQKPSRVSGKITPNITDSEEEDEIFEVDGGEARIDVKTK